jgi:hypothetical protein
MQAQHVDSVSIGSDSMFSVIDRWIKAGLFGHRKTLRGSARPRTCLPTLETLESRFVPTVTFHGGATLPHVQVQALYIGSDWATVSALKVQKTNTDTFLKSIVNSPYMDMLTNAGYGVGRGTALPGVVDAVTLNKNNSLTDATIQSIIGTEIQNHKLAAPNAETLVFVYVEPGVVVDANTNPHIGGTSVFDFLGYHDSFKTKAGKNVAYAVIPYQAGINGSDPQVNTEFKSSTDVSSHELAEAATDPGTNGTPGWYDDTNNGEIADLTDKLRTLNGYVVQDVVNKNDQTIGPVA